MCDDALKALTYLSTFIKKNPSLLHLDLSHAGLQSLMIEKLVQAASESQSLMAMHLCGNPGINNEIKLFI